MKRALFLDRDGVINIDKDYVHKAEDIEFVDGIFQFLNTASELGFELVVITNQSGIARGMFNAEDVDRLHKYMDKEFSKHGVSVSRYYYCPHHPDITGACSCRKPETGMVTQAAEELGLNIKESVIIGDKKSDIKTGKHAEMACTILLKGNYEEKPTGIEDIFVSDLYEAEKYLKEYCEA